MLGMLLETVNADAIGIDPCAVSDTPRATAIAHCRTKPVMRDRIVPADITAVERASDGGGSLMGSSMESGSCTEDDSSPRARARTRSRMRAVALSWTGGDFS